MKNVCNTFFKLVLDIFRFFFKKNYMGKNLQSLFIYALNNEPWVTSAALHLRKEVFNKVT